MAIVRYAQDHGHTVITKRIVEEATRQLMPARAAETMEHVITHAARTGGIAWSPEAEKQMNTIQHSEEAVRNNVRLRAEKAARQAGSKTVQPDHVTTFLPEIIWDDAALARLAHVPEGFMRDGSKRQIEQYARNRQISKITLETAEAGLAIARRSMMHATSQQERQAISWEVEAEKILETIPVGVSRKMTRQAVEAIAARKNLLKIDAAFVETILKTFHNGSKEVAATLPWEPSAEALLTSVPATVRGMLIHEIEGWATRHGLQSVNADAVRTVFKIWSESGSFHLDPKDARYLSKSP